jgi:hypothetical protein
MRRLSYMILLTMAAASVLVVRPALAQLGGGGGGRGGPGGGAGGDSDDDAKKKQRELDFGGLNAPLPKVRSAGPCPFVKVLYDAARYVPFKNNIEDYANVGYTGEIEDVVSDCAYAGDQPITLKAKVRFELGRGPTATGRENTYHYWVAVTDRNHAVLDKVYFNMPITFPTGTDRVTHTETLNRIVIPRKDARVSGANFEVLVGFDVTPQMAAFNRDGKRFRPNVGQTAQASSGKS